MHQDNFQSIDINALVTVGGGQAQQGAPADGGEDAAPSRNWGQVAREYGAACIQGAGQSLVYGGRPRNLRSGLVNAGMGCAMGVGMKAVDDVSQAISGS